MIYAEVSSFMRLHTLPAAELWCSRSFIASAMRSVPIVYSMSGVLLSCQSSQALYAAKSADTILCISTSVVVEVT